MLNSVVSSYREVQLITSHIIAQLIQLYVAIVKLLGNHILICLANRQVKT